MSTPTPGFTKKRKPVVEPDLNMRPKQGYTSYPAHLFDVPPSCLNVELLRKKYLISEIAKSRAAKNFFERGVLFMNFLTSAANNLAEDNGYKLTKNKETKNKTDHEYCMSQDASFLPDSPLSTQVSPEEASNLKSKL